MNGQITTPTPHDDVSIENYRRLMARYERLMEISRQLNSTLDLGALLGHIVRAATELTGTEEASILLIDPATGELRFEAASNLTRAEMEAIPVPLEGSLGGWVATHGEPLLVADARSDSRWFRDVDKTIQFKTRNLLAVPMQIHNKIIGVLEAINKKDDQPWTNDDVNTLTALSSQAAIAVQNARLFQQSDFIAEMVHELRTPLAGLRASIALLLRPTLPDERRHDIMETMQQETERLTAMTNDFLDLARLESGRTRLEMRRFELERLLWECAEVVRQQASERQIAITIHECPYVVAADRDKIKQVLLNLLTNAIKYNRQGGAIICGAQMRTTGSGVPKVVVSVQDTGHGISEEDQKRVFDKFFRIADTAGYTTGTGLGLAIARRIIEAHGCEMGLVSELGAGTTFYFTLLLSQ